MRAPAVTAETRPQGCMPNGSSWMARLWDELCELYHSVSAQIRI
jgi:hypothetical protein